MQAFAYYVNNAIPVTTWDGDPNDTALWELIEPLKRLSKVKDVRPVIADISDFHRCALCKEFTAIFVLSFGCRSDRKVSVFRVPVTGFIVSGLPSGPPDWSPCLSP